MFWQKIEDVRQVRPDHAVEVKVNGVWHLGYTLEWARRHTMGGPAQIGELVGPLRLTPHPLLATGGCPNPRRTQ